MAAILWLSYPTSDIPWDSIYEVLPSLIPALRKYIMEDVEKALRTAVLKSDALKRQPLRIFAIARQCGWDDVARVAARFVLSIPILEHGVVEEMKMVTAFDYQLLLDYFRRSSEAVPELMRVDISRRLPQDSPVLDILPSQYQCVMGCTAAARDTFSTSFTSISERSDFHRRGHPWIKVMLQDAREMLREQPGKSLLDPHFVENAVWLAARECPTQGAVGVRALLEVLDNEVKHTLAEIELKLEG